MNVEIKKYYDSYEKKPYLVVRWGSRKDYSGFIRRIVDFFLVGRNSARVDIGSLEDFLDSMKWIYRVEIDGWNEMESLGEGPHRTVKIE